MKATEAKAYIGSLNMGGGMGAGLPSIRIENFRAILMSCSRPAACTVAGGAPQTLARLAESEPSGKEFPEELSKGIFSVPEFDKVIATSSYMGKYSLDLFGRLCNTAPCLDDYAAVKEGSNICSKTLKMLRALLLQKAAALSGIYNLGDTSQHFLAKILWLSGATMAQ